MAHHSRLWDRKFGAKGVTDAQGVSGYFQGFGAPAQSKDMYGVLTIMAFLPHSIEGCTAWSEDIAELIESSFAHIPSKAPAGMGFPSGWKTLYPWCSGD